MDRAPTLANRLLGTLKTMGRWAVERGLVEGNPFSDHRPGPSTDRDRVLNEAELRALLLALKAEPYHQGQMVKMLALSAARRSEVSEMRWSEIDLDAKIWRLPRERAKNDTEHVVPLSDDAVSILQAAPRFDGSDFVFSSRGDHGVTKFDRFKRRIDASMAASLGHAPEHWTLHDLRRTAASGMAELGVAPHVIEACLNHRSGIIRGVARTYNRFAYTNEKAAAFQAWSRRLREIETGKSAPSNVVTLARA